MNDVQQMLSSAEAVLHGHFQLSSGAHSDTYVQCARLLQQPDRAEAVAVKLAKALEKRPDVVVAPALGGIVIGHELARALGCRCVFAERDATGALTLRRGFDLAEGERAVVAEDVITTGGSALETAQLATRHGASVEAIASIVRRVPRTGSASTQPEEATEHEYPGWSSVSGIPAVSLVEIRVQTSTASHCGLCAQGVALDSPGSRRTATASV